MEVNKLFNVVIKERNIVICKNAKIADGFWDRMVGLMFLKNMDGFDGLLISPCNQIHTFFMRFSIDLIFLSRKNRVVKIIHDKSPWKMSLMYFKAIKVLEIKSLDLKQEIKVGDEVTFVCIN